MVQPFRAREDTPGSSPAKVSGKREQKLFNAEVAAHEQSMADKELGTVGKFIGGPSTAATLAALITLVAGGCFAGFAEYQVASHPDVSQIWTRMFDLSLGLFGTALGFLAGRSGAGGRH